MTTATMQTKETPSVDAQKVQQFAGQVILDMSAGMSAIMAQIGHELGLYKAMIGHTALTANSLAAITGMNQRYLQEWLNNQAAGGYIEYDAGNKTYHLPFEHALVLAEEQSPAFLAAGFNVIGAVWLNKDNVTDAFRTGHGIGWHQQHHHLFCGVESFYRSGYRSNLVDQWIPSLTGIEQKLVAGARVADIGCGHGASIIIMAKKYPDSFFYGFDYHAESITIARLRAAEAGITNAVFEVATADAYEHDNFDLICFMDSFHDMGNPLEAIRYARTKLSAGGSLMLVEPASFDNIEENFNPIGRMFYAGSTVMCVPNARSQQGGYALGAQAGPAAVEKLVYEAGYKHYRIAQRTLVNLVFEARG